MSTDKIHNAVLKDALGIGNEHAQQIKRFSGLDAKVDWDRRILILKGDGKERWIPLEGVSNMTPQADQIAVGPKWEAGKPQEPLRSRIEPSGAMEFQTIEPPKAQQQPKPLPTPIETKKKGRPKKKVKEKELPPPPADSDKGLDTEDAF